MGRPTTFVVYTLSYDPRSGGIVVLHLLCHLLNANGERAFLWPMPPMPSAKQRSPVRKLVKAVKLAVRHRLSRFETDPDLDTPIARRANLRDAVVVYPEITRGNPLGAKHVVRWLLHRPGFHTGVIDYGPDDLFFAYQPAFNDAAVTRGQNNVLTITYLLDRIYRQDNFGARAGSCTILRKGKNRPIVHDLTGSIVVDDMSHEEMAKVFNTVEVCWSYDLYTMYAVYAALCGCKVIVVPEPGVSKEAWQPVPELRYGIAYGVDDLPEAERTRPLLAAYFHGKQAENATRARAFADQCRGYFGLSG